MKSAYLSGFIAALLVLLFSQTASAFFHDLAWLALYGLVNVGLGFGVYLIGVSRISGFLGQYLSLSMGYCLKPCRFEGFGEIQAQLCRVQLLVIDQTAHVISDVDHADLDFGTRHANGSDIKPHTVLLITKNMFDSGANGGPSGIGNSCPFRHGATLGL
jgi:hypothetical protein